MNYIELITEKIQHAQSDEERCAYQTALALYCLKEQEVAEHQIEVELSFRHARHRQLQAAHGEATCPDKLW